MLPINLGQIQEKINFSAWRRSFRRTVKYIVAHEKILLAILAIIIVISGGFWYRQFSSNNSDSPTVGGTYVEGIIFDKEKKELSQITARLTKTGLLTFSSDGQLAGQLAEKWSVNDNQTEYRFTLEEGVDRDEIIATLNERDDVVGQIEILDDNNGDIVVKLVDSNPSFPLLMTRPLFDYGPYKLGKSNDQTTVFTRSTNKKAVPAFINKIIIHTYANEDDLLKALKSNRLDGAVLASKSQTPPPKNFKSYQIALNRYYVVLFNFNKTPFRDNILRKALIGSETVPATPFTLIVADQEPYKTLATEIVSQWQGRGSKAELSTKPLQEVTSSIGPSRNFQSLFIGIDYGLEMDPFYLWHSSQVRATGNNITGVINPTIDSLVDKTRANLNIIERQASIDELQKTLIDQGVMLLAGRESDNYVLSNKIKFVQPFLPASSADRFLAIPLWSVK